MKNYEFILKRRSIRKYKNIDIPENDIELLLKAAMHAPIPYKNRTWKLILIREKNLIEKISLVSGKQTWIKDANLIIVGVITPVKRAKKWKIVDITIALENIILMVEALGYGSCWVGYFSEKKLKELLNIPLDYQILAYITVGVKDEIPYKRDYGKMDDFISENRFS